MRYPIKCNYISYQKCTDSDDYVVKNYLNDRYSKVVRSDIEFMEMMDGRTDPIPILRKTMPPDKAFSYLMDLERKELIRFSKTLYSRLGSFMRTLFIIRDSSRFKILAMIFNYALMLSLIPAMYLACMNVKYVMTGYLTGELTVAGTWSYVGLLGGIIAGGLFHEFAHALACICYGGKVMEIGVMFQGYPGAYTLMDCTPINKRLQRVQAYFAGIEMNTLLMCISVVLCRYHPEWFPFLFEFGLINLEFALTNLLFIDGLDGTAIMSAILGDEDLLENAIGVVFDEGRERKLKRYGVNGKARIMAAYLLGTSKLYVPIMYVFNITMLLGVML